MSLPVSRLGNTRSSGLRRPLSTRAAGKSWWLGLDRQAFVAQAASQTPRMEASREAQWVRAYRVEVAGKAEML